MYLNHYTHIPGDIDGNLSDQYCRLHRTQRFRHFFHGRLADRIWKYLCMRRHPQAEAPHYVNIAHRAALMYAFSSQLLAVFAALSAFPGWLNTVAVIPPLVFFAIALAHYVELGMTTDSKNSLRDSPDKAKDYRILNVLAVAEIGGFSVLLIGFFVKLWA
jgi:hypothetical protein